MPYLKWTSNLSVGDTTLDGHHKNLIDLINTAYESRSKSARNERGTLSTDAILAELLDYTRYHFVEEEKVMEAASFPDLEEHRRLHADLIQKLAELRHRSKMTPSAVSAVDIFDFLSQWLIRHILVKDLRFQPYIKIKH